MELHELLSKGASEIRRDEKLMRLYIEYFKGAFSFTPSCAGCTFNKDFKKLQSWSQKNGNSKILPNLSVMEESKKYTIKNRHRNTILSYSQDGNTFRMYGYRASDAFVEKYLNNSSPNQRKERLKMFDINEDQVDLSELKRAELDAIAEGKGIDPKQFKNKGEIIDALNESGK